MLTICSQRCRQVMKSVWGGGQIFDYDLGRSGGTPPHNFGGCFRALRQLLQGQIQGGGGGGYNPPPPPNDFKKPSPPWSEV